MGAKNATNQAHRAHKLAERLHLSGIGKAVVATISTVLVTTKRSKGFGNAKRTGKQPGKSSKQANA